MPEKKFEEKKMVPWDPPGVPRVPISGPVHGMFSKCNVHGPIGSRGHSHTGFRNGRFYDRQTSFHIDVIQNTLILWARYLALGSALLG